MSTPPAPIRLNGEPNQPAAARRLLPRGPVVAEPKPAPPPPPVEFRPPDLWDRGVRMVVFLILFLIPTLYAIALPTGAIRYLSAHSEAWWYPIYSLQLSAFLSYCYTPLPLKLGAFSVLVAGLAMFGLIGFLGRRRSGSLVNGQRLDWALYGPILLLMAWSSISLTYTPTLYYSLLTFASMTFGLIWLLAVYHAPKTQRLVRRWFNTVVLAAGVVAGVALLQDLDRNHVITGLFFINLDSVYPHDPTALRQRLGSLIGHNIGVASLVSFSWFIVLSRLFQTMPWPRKLGWAAVGALFFYILVATQTRGIWIVMAVLTPIHLYWLMWITNRRWDLKPILGVFLLLLIILTLQMWPSDRNPFYSPESPLNTRLRHFSISHLTTETRLRIARISMPLVAESPLLGHGLGSFQYIYPRAQGDYFARHPDSLLMPVTTRTVQAHSDWLQLVLELGLPGLLIVAVGLSVLLRRGWRGCSRIGDANLRLEMTAALMAVIAIMFHALADFPGHVISSVANGLFMLGIWASCGRIVEEGRPVVLSDGPWIPLPSFRARPLAFAGAILVVPLALGSAAWCYKQLQVSMYETMGVSYRSTFGDRFADLSDKERLTYLQAASEAYRRAQRMAPLSQEIRFRRGELETVWGDMLFQRIDDNGRTGEEKFALAREAHQRLSEALTLLQVALREVRFHDAFWLMGMAHDDLSQLYPPRDLRHQEHRAKAKESLKQSIRYSPGFTRAHWRLFQVLRRENPMDQQTAEQMGRLVRQIFVHDPLMFVEKFMNPVEDDIRRRNPRKAAFMIDVPIQATNNSSDLRRDLLLRKAHLLAYAGQGAQAEVVLNGFALEFPKYPPERLLGYRMEAAAASGRYEEAVRLATAALHVPLDDLKFIHPYYRIVRAAALEKAGRPEAKAEWALIEKEAQSIPAYYATMAEVWHFLMSDPERARPYVERACESATEEGDAWVCRIAAETAWEKGEKEKALDYLERALELDKEDEAAHELMKKFSADR